LISLIVEELIIFSHVLTIHSSCYFTYFLDFFSLNLNEIIKLNLSYCPY